MLHQREVGAAMPSKRPLDHHSGWDLARFITSRMRDTATKGPFQAARGMAEAALRQAAGRPRRQQAADAAMEPGPARGDRNVRCLWHPWAAATV